MLCAFVMVSNGEQMTTEEFVKKYQGLTATFTDACGNSYTGKVSRVVRKWDSFLANTVQAVELIHSSGAVMWAHVKELKLIDIPDAKQCECGSAKLKMPKHSSWCPMTK